VLVTGGRDYNTVETVYRTLDRYRTVITVLGHGSARGADTLCEEWAKSRQVNYQGFPAKWDSIGGAAGPVRNKEMLDNFKPDVLVVFPGGTGTQNMVSIAVAAGVTIDKAEL
jgi:hypothetical protein